MSTQMRPVEAILESLKNEIKGCESYIPISYLERAYKDLQDLETIIVDLTAQLLGKKEQLNKLTGKPNQEKDGFIQSCFSKYMYEDEKRLIEKFPQLAPDVKVFQNYWLSKLNKAESMEEITDYFYWYNEDIKSLLEEVEEQ